MFKRENVISSNNMSGDCQHLRLLEDGFATATTLDRTEYPPLLECWYSQVGVRGDIITWFPMTGCGGGSGGSGIQTINGNNNPHQYITGADGAFVRSVNNVTTISAPNVAIPVSSSGWLPLSADEYYQDFTHNLGKTPVIFRLFDGNGVPISESGHTLLNPNTLRVRVGTWPDGRFSGTIYIG